MKRRLRCTLTFLWYDLWIGAYYDRKEKTLYVCPLPMCVLKFWREIPREPRS